MGSCFTDLYLLREKRINDVVLLKEPDMVPFFPLASLYAPWYAGVSFKEAYEEPSAWLNAHMKMNQELQPDLLFNATSFLSSQVYQALDLKQLVWPGHGISENTPHQYSEAEYLLEKEYDELINDPSDFVIRKYLPRTLGKMAPFSKLPPISVFLFGYPAIELVTLLNTTGMQEAWKVLTKAGEEASIWVTARLKYEQEMTKLGFPLFTKGRATAPFDFIADFLRGIKGSMMDIHRVPDKLLAVMDKVYPLILLTALTMAKMGNNNRVYIPLHCGADGFMSEKHFDKFYWPQLKTLVLDLIREDMMPCLFYEGNWDSRLKYLAELPKAKTIGMFDRTDLANVKKVLGNVMCISGNMPADMLKYGTVEQVEKYTKLLIETAGEGGGFIMSNAAIMDNAEPELVRAWRDATRKYGVY